jgi:hypothetical protein
MCVNAGDESSGIVVLGVSLGILDVVVVVAVVVVRGIVVGVEIWVIVGEGVEGISIEAVGTIDELEIPLII